MDDFFIDKHGEGEEENQNIISKWSDCEEDDDEIEKRIDGLDQLSDFSEEEETKSKKTNSKYSLDDTYLVSNYTKTKQKEVYSGINKVLEKSSIKPGLEQQHAVNKIKSKRILKIEKKKLQDKTKGKKWFDIPATEVTPEIKNDFQVLKMRGVLDKKHMYKKNDITSILKYFQVGTVLESPADFYSGRIVKGQRKKTIVDELLADAECRSYQKKKYKEIMRRKSFRR